MIAIIAIAIINFLKPTDDLQGTFVYTESVKYEFSENGNGAMYDSNIAYQYTYSIEGSTLKLDFKDEAVKDATYTFSIENDTLTLIGGEGTIGGEYISERESK